MKRTIALAACALAILLGVKAIVERRPAGLQGVLPLASELPGFEGYRSESYRTRAGGLHARASASVPGTRLLIVNVTMYPDPELARAAMKQVTAPIKARGVVAPNGSPSGRVLAEEVWNTGRAGSRSYTLQAREGKAILSVALSDSSRSRRIKGQPVFTETELLQVEEIAVRCLARLRSGGFTTR